ncbi:Protein XRI1 [Raphanus sativus]|nr:protein XRI1-like isoform X2 [Raphanus sativus]KAJ4868769.1 Protein XRI1 [Raphanus sativus]
MDYRKDRGSSWNWQSHYCNHKPQSRFSDVRECTMIEVTLNQEDHSYMFDDDNESTTPVKACTESGYHHVTTDETIKKKLEVPRETRSSVKRRRMLQFEDQPVETTLFRSESFSSILRSSAREDSFDELLPEGSQLIEDASASSFEGIDELYAEEWYVDCLNDPEAPTLPDDLSFGSPDVHVDISEYLNLPPETSEVKRPVTRSSPNVIFKARKSFARPVPKLASSSVIYPFSFIKPCGMVDGDIMTLKDINQKILTPPGKPKENKAETTPVIQTSAFSGKPVVGKTKIRTEGGKGSITIMRTRG